MGWLNKLPAIPYAKILLVTLNCTSLPSFIQIGPKLPNLVIWGGFWLGIHPITGWVDGSGGINMGLTTHVMLFRCISPKMISIQNFVNIGHKIKKLAHQPVSGVVGWLEWSDFNFGGESRFSYHEKAPQKTV